MLVQLEQDPLFDVVASVNPLDRRRHCPSRTNLPSLNLHLSMAVCQQSTDHVEVVDLKAHPP